MYQAESLSQNVAIIDNGTIKQIGTKQKIFGKSNKNLISFARLENVFFGFSSIKEGISMIQVSAVRKAVLTA